MRDGPRQGAGEEVGEVGVEEHSGEETDVGVDEVGEAASEVGVSMDEEVGAEVGGARRKRRLGEASRHGERYDVGLTPTHSQ